MATAGGSGEGSNNGGNEEGDRSNQKFILEPESILDHCMTPVSSHSFYLKTEANFSDNILAKL